VKFSYATNGQNTVLKLCSTLKDFNVVSYRCYWRILWIMAF